VIQVDTIRIRTLTVECLGVGLGHGVDGGVGEPELGLVLAHELGVDEGEHAGVHGARSGGAVHGHDLAVELDVVLVAQGGHVRESTARGVEGTCGGQVG